MTQLGIIGLGRMGANIAKRLAAGGHRCVGFDPLSTAAEGLNDAGVDTVDTIDALLDRLDSPRNIWLMVPSGEVDDVLDKLIPNLSPNDLVIDGGNSHFKLAAERASKLEAHQIHFVDVGTSGGVWGLERGYCLMVGGEATSFARLEEIFQTLAPGVDAASPTVGRESARSTADRGYLHCGGHGAGHFVKMVHNGIEYGMMAAFAEGFQLLSTAAEEFDDFDFECSEVAELWRRGSVVESWLLDLTAKALTEDPKLEELTGHVDDSGEGRWTIQTAVDLGVPVQVLAAALYQRFSSRGLGDFANRALSAMRREFGGHREKK
ncbi:MAG: phosphogluconate dehydrogenase (NAD(+)-dependent, decarboxylating) [Pseudomonadota bacterium]